MTIYIKRNSVTKILALLPLIAGCIFARAQSPDTAIVPRWAVYQVNPLGLISKERIKVERRLTPVHSISICYTKFHGISTDNQLFGEYRHYSIEKTNAVFFLYGKAGGGTGTTGGFETGETYGAYQYYLAGGGAGWHVNMGRKKHFFFDISMGLKYTGVYHVADNSDNGDPKTTFYLFGSGSPVDISSCFGWQFR